MKTTAAALAITLGTASAFVAPSAKPTGTTLQSTVESEAPTVRVAPGAGWEPEWEGKTGLAPAEFVKSDMDKPDLSGMWECPLTRWDSDGIDVKAAQETAAEMPHCPYEVHASAEDSAAGAAYFAQNKDQLRADLVTYGAIWFRGFELMQSVAGNREMHEALGLAPCLDPLHSSGLRKFASERDALYEEVNKPSLRQHYIGLHNESTAKRTAAYAAFVCFQRATEGGGRFLVADGAAVLAELKPEFLQKIYDRQIRISVSNLDIPPSFPPIVKEGIKNLVKEAVAPKFDMDLEMIYESDGKPGRLQAVETAESPINRHPVTGLPVWFSNTHNHARKLRDRRPCGVPEVGMTEIFYADTMKPMDLEDCQEIKRASEKHITALSMEPGDVLLVDNYRALHGRDVFDGDRFHAVTWFTWDEHSHPDNADWRGDERRIVEKNAFNQVINGMMDWLPKDFVSDQS